MNQQNNTKNSSITHLLLGVVALSEFQQTSIFFSRATREIVGLERKQNSHQTKQMTIKGSMNNKLNPTAASLKSNHQANFNQKQFTLQPYLLLNVYNIKLF